MRRKTTVRERKNRIVGDILRWQPVYGYDSGVYTQARAALLKLSRDELVSIRLIIDQVVKNPPASIDS